MVADCQNKKHHSLNKKRISSIRDIIEIQRKDNDVKVINICPICKKKNNTSLGAHIRTHHSETELIEAIQDVIAIGLPNIKIMKIFDLTLTEFEKIIIDKYGIDISSLKNQKSNSCGPINFQEETTTVWSFPQRGEWATHNNKYRGNWSPYVPRNLIIKYSNPGDIVLDFFCGSGTTAIEAKLLGRKCYAIDINPSAVELTKRNLNFNSTQECPIFEPIVSIGDARYLSHIRDRSIDLICTHPPYANIIQYSSNIKGDISLINVEEFINQMKKVARESFRILKNGGICAFLIGDTRKNKRVIPLGFKTIQVFLESGFILKELIIKLQHNCKTTKYWKTRNKQMNFLLLAHEYLPVFEKSDTYTHPCINFI